MSDDFDPTSLPDYSNVQNDLVGMACDAYDVGYAAGYAQGKADQAAADNPPVWSEDWTSPTTLTTNWGVYNGAGAYSSQGVRLTRNVSTGFDADLYANTCRVYVGPLTSATTIGGHTLNAGDFAAGGVYPTAGKFGPGHRWVMSVRMSAPAAGTRGVFMLWGDDSGSIKWPAAGELDFVEAGAARADRQSCTVTNHWAGATGGNAQLQDTVSHDFTQWTTVEVIWAADNSSITVAFDGTVVATFTDHLPPGTASFRFQTALEGGGQSPTYQGAPRQASWIDCGPIKVYRLADAFETRALRAS